MHLQLRGVRSINSLIPVAFILTVLVLFYIMRSDADMMQPIRGPFHFEYTALPGIFLQSEHETDSKRFDFKKQNFGLINRNYDTDDGPSNDKDQWERFERYVRHLNSQSEHDVQYKVLFLGRHGQGYHNVAEAKYGTKQWNCYWSMLDGAEGIIWADAHLTNIGEVQAQEVHALWQSLLPHIPAPDTYYVSPLTRALQTADLSFQGLDLPDGRKYKPIVKELLREAIGVHTCDRRSSRSQLQKHFPHVQFEEGFSEADPLWTSDFREPRLARRHRLGQLLDDVFAHDGGTFLSLTSHSGAIRSILQVLGHRPFELETGGVIPVLVRAQRVEGQRERPPREPSEGPPACSAAPGPPDGVPN